MNELWWNFLLFISVPFIHKNSVDINLKKIKLLLVSFAHIHSSANRLNSFCRHSFIFIMVQLFCNHLVFFRSYSSVALIQIHSDASRFVDNNLCSLISYYSFVEHWSKLFDKYLLNCWISKDSNSAERSHIVAKPKFVESRKLYKNYH